jgi:hypothetical protein
MDEYRPNSHKSRDEKREAPPEKKIEKVISGEAKSKKKSDVQRFADVFIQEDVKNVKTYIFMDVLVPAIKKAISDIVRNGIDMILYGEADRGRKNANASKVSYGKYYESDNNRRREYTPVPARNNYDFDDLLFETRGDADAVLEAMNDIISQYGVVSIADLYDLANVTTNNYTAAKYGWTNIPTNLTPVRVRDGYILKLPRALPL